MSDPRAEDRARAESLVDVSRETWERMEALVALLDRWQAKTNLVSPATLPEIWTRHVADSLQLAPLAMPAPGAAAVWVDLGSGGGFPGLPIAAVIGDRVRMHLVESNAKKAAFLREAARAIGVSVVVHAARAEDVIGEAVQDAGVVSSRALTALGGLVGLSAPLLKKGALGLFPKGREAASELTEALKFWKFEASLHPSLTQPDARIVRVDRFLGSLREPRTV